MANTEREQLAVIQENLGKLTYAEIGKLCDPELSDSQVRRRVKKLKDPPPDEKHAKVVELVEKALREKDIPIGEVEKISQLDIKNWQMGYKDEEGEGQVLDLEGIRVKLELKPTWADGPEWPVIQPAAPTVIKPVSQKRADRDFKVAVVLPDPQIGFREDLATREFDPFHDEMAISVAMQIIRDVRPDLIVNLGDLLDFPEWGTFEQEPGFQRTTQATLNRAHRFLAEQKANAPEAETVLIEGNHDRRLQKSIVKNAAAAFGLKRAELPDSWPVLSVPHLLRLDELGVEYVSGYPAGNYWINDRLKCVHGRIVRSAGSTAKAVSQDERVSTIFGHVHRIEMHYKTVNVKGGGKTNLAYSPGCLCRIDGAVPSAKGSTDVMGRPILSYEDWQQGLGVVTYLDGDSPFTVEPVYIHEGNAFFRGKLYGAVSKIR